MRYFYISRNEIINNQSILVYDIFDIEVLLEAYRTGNGKEDAIQYIGENIPNDWVYDEENDVIFSEADRPSPYHVFIKGTWIVKDRENYKLYCNEEIDKIKAKTLEYGFDYDGHRQRCRDKDIVYLTSTVVSLQVAKQVLNKDKKAVWYFEDNQGVEMDLTAISTLMLYGTTFVQSVFNTENYFKNIEEARVITLDEFEEKRKEIHRELAEG